jgi:hypothetical protein
MNNKMKPALYGGLIVGILSVIPIVNLANFCCCLWAIVGGGVASYLYVKGSASPVKAGDGAMLGALAGLIGAGIAIVVGIPLSIVAGGITRQLMLSLVQSLNPGQVEMMQRQMEAGASVVGAIVNGLILAVCLIVFSTLGGLIGIPIFEKRKGDVPPPPAM